MATLAAAELARSRSAEQLRGLGAHALEVARIGQTKDADYGVVAYFASKPTKAVPKTIQVTHRHKKHVVRVKVKVARPFELQARAE